MNIITHSDWQTFIDSLLFEGAVKPTATGYYLLLCNMATPITKDTPKNTIISQELSGDGYTRKQLTGGTASFISGELKRTYPPITHIFTATKSYRYLVLMGNATATPGNTNGIIVGFIDEGTDQIVISGQILELNVGYSIGN